MSRRGQAGRLEAAGLQSRWTQNSPRYNALVRWLVPCAIRFVNRGARRRRPRGSKPVLVPRKGGGRSESGTRQPRPQQARPAKESSCCIQLKQAEAHRFFITLRGLHFDSPNLCHCQTGFVCLVLGQPLDCHVMQRQIKGWGVINAQPSSQALGSVARDTGWAVGCCGAE